MARHKTVLLAFLIGLAAGCGSEQSPTGPTGPTPLPVTIHDVGSSRRLTESGGHSYAVWATVVTSAAVVGTGEVSVTFSGGAAPPLTYREPRAFSLAPGTGMLNFQIPDQAGVAHTAVQVTIAVNDTAGRTAQAVGSGAVRDFIVPELTASADRTTLATGETTRLHWRASGATSVTISPIVPGVPGFGAEGSIEITPCPGTTEFDVSAHNISGEVHVRIPITVERPPSPWYCGNWSGPSTETWTDAAGTPGSWSGGVTLSAFQSAGRVTGRFIRSLQLHGSLARPLDAALGRSDGSLVATIPVSAPGFPYEPGPRFACPIELDARLSPDGSTITGTFRAQCRPDGAGEVTLRGQFEATKHDNPYPLSFLRR